MRILVWFGEWAVWRVCANLEEAKEELAYWQNRSSWPMKLDEEDAEWEREQLRLAAGMIGAPGSIMRYVHNTSWGNNKFAVFEYVQGQAVVRASQPTKSGAQYFMQRGRFLVDLTTKTVVEHTPLAAT